MYQKLVEKTPANNIWNAFFVQSALEDLKTEGNFTALSAAIAGSASVGTWILEATTLGLVDITGPAYATTITPQMQLAMGAYAAYKLSISGTTTWYSTYPSNWVTSNIQNFKTDYVTAT